MRWDIFVRHDDHIHYYDIIVARLSWVFIIRYINIINIIFCLYANIAYHNHQPKSALKSPTRRRDTGYPQSEGLLLYGFTWRKTFTRTARFEKLKLPLSAKHQPWAKHPHSPKRVNIKIILLVTCFILDSSLHPAAMPTRLVSFYQIHAITITLHLIVIPWSIAHSRRISNHLSAQLP